MPFSKSEEKTVKKRINKIIQRHGGAGNKSVDAIVAYLNKIVQMMPHCLSSTGSYTKKDLPFLPKEIIEKISDGTYSWHKGWLIDKKTTFRVNNITNEPGE